MGESSLDGGVVVRLLRKNSRRRINYAGKKPGSCRPKLDETMTRLEAYHKDLCLSA